MAQTSIFIETHVFPSLVEAQRPRFKVGTVSTTSAFAFASQTLPDGGVRRPGSASVGRSWRLFEYLSGILYVWVCIYIYNYKYIRMHMQAHIYIYIYVYESLNFGWSCLYSSIGWCRSFTMLHRYPYYGSNSLTLKMRWFDDIWCNFLTWTSNIERHRGWFPTEKKQNTVTLKDTGWSDIMRRSRKNSRLWKCHRQGNHADRDHKVRGSPGVCSGLRRLTWRVYQQDMVFPSQWDFRWFNHDEFGTIYNQNTCLVWWSQDFLAPLRVDELEFLQSKSGCGIVRLLGGVAWIFVDLGTGGLEEWWWMTMHGAIWLFPTDWLTRFYCNPKENILPMFWGNILYTDDWITFRIVRFFKLVYDEFGWKQQ